MKMKKKTMTEKEFTIKGKNVVVKPEEGTLEDGVLKVNRVKIKLDNKTHTVPLDEMQDWDEAAGTVMNYLALDQLEYKVESPELVDIDGDDTAAVGKDTKIFKCILATARLQIASTEALGDVFGFENPSSYVSNATYRGFIQAVAENGTKHYYSVTPEGWKQIISHYGITDWIGVADDMMVDDEEISDSESEDTSLDEYTISVDEEDLEP